MANAIRRKGLLDNLVELMTGAQEPRGDKKKENKAVAEAANRIRVRSVCLKPDTTTRLTWTQYRFDPLPTKCPQCKGKVVVDPMMVKILCYLEKEEIG